MFTTKDLNQIAALNIPIDEVEKQINNFIQGFPFLHTLSPATPKSGITKLNEAEQKHYIKIYDLWQGTAIKFVPASGAATRMFKNLYEALQNIDNNVTIDWNNKSMTSVRSFFTHLQNKYDKPTFAFRLKLQQILKAQNINLESLKESDYSKILHTLLNSEGLNYGTLPKGLIDFHLYQKNHDKKLIADNLYARTAFEEHLMEAALYAQKPSKIAQLHFTVSPEHNNDFKKLYNKVAINYEELYNVKFNVSFSKQKKSTDTIAVDMNNQIFRNTDGTLLFRPAGHGALLENLNELNTDIVFIKNIDSVIPQYHVEQTIRWKKIIAGFLIEKQEKTYEYLRALESTIVNEEILKEIMNFLTNTFNVIPPNNINKNNITSYLKEKLNRPIRVCGMVKNEGEPGGGPFMVCDKDGSATPQIAEAQQININDPQQLKILKQSTHFNPVDLVCGLRNYNGNKFNLLNYRDDSTGFISIKSKDGKALKAQELPGLWNGAMSNWNTIFIEVPLITFNPVKIVNDLLRKEHQLIY